jgi:UDP-N-acetylmuramoyl-tripeptide--D-alanyl-D-alanine ligase
MIVIDLDILLKIINGKIINSFENYDYQINITRICTDTRKLQKGDSFLTLKGENFNGNAFIQSGIEKGAICVICDEIPNNTIMSNDEIPIILVKDSTHSYGRIANYYRNNFLQNAKVIAITGSVGKTTTKNLLGFVLKNLNLNETVYLSEANLNNQIGVPYNILNAPANSKYVVLEMGMQRLGEIDYLSEIAEPDIAIVVNVSGAHLEFFENIEEIAKAKSEIFNHLKSNGWCVINESNYSTVLLESANRVTNNIILYENDVNSSNLDKGFCDFCIKNYMINSDNSCDIEISIKDYGNLKYKLSLGLVSLIKNSMIPFIVGKILNLNLNLISEIIGKFSNDELKGRGKIIFKEIDGQKVLFLDETYNCGVEAMEASLKNLVSLPFKNIDDVTLQIGKRIAILGEMKELGIKSQEIHQNLLRFLNGIDLIITIGGENIKSLNDLIDRKKNFGHFNDVNDFISHGGILKILNYVKSLSNSSENEDVLILIKGARSNELEKIFSSF